MSHEVRSVVGGKASWPCNDDDDITTVDDITTEAAGTPPTFKGDATLFHPGSPDNRNGSASKIRYNTLILCRISFGWGECATCNFKNGYKLHNKLS